MGRQPPLVPERPRRRRDWGLRIVAGLGVLLVAGAIFALIALLGSDQLPTYGPSMRPTLAGRADVDVDESAYAEALPAIGDIVVAQAPSGAETRLCGIVRRPDSPCGRPTDDYSTIRVLKRVVAGPGDRVAFTANGGLVRNGSPVDEPYILPCPGSCSLPAAVTVPADHWFLAGDNRPASDDSRAWGPVALEAIDGQVILSGES